MKFWQKILLVLFLAAVVVFLVAFFYFRRASTPGPSVSTWSTPGVSTWTVLKLAVMADIHSAWEDFEKALNIAKADGINLVIIAGDLTAVGDKKELLAAKKILDGTQLKYFVIPGNHDVWYSRKIKQNVFGEVFGKNFDAYRFGSIKLIMLDNADYSQGQETWLKKEAWDCLKIYCLVFMHLPLNHPYSSHVMGEGEPAVATAAGKLKEILVQNKVKEIFAGHIHLSNQYEIDGLKTTIVGALTEDRNPQTPRFLEVSIKENGSTGYFLLEKKEIVLEP